MKKPIDDNFMPKATGRVFKILCSDKFIGKFTLVGGTALALQIGHRQSEDLDFIFDGDKLPLASIKSNMVRLFPQARIVRLDQEFQIDYSVDGVKVTFFTTGAIGLTFRVKDYSVMYEKMNIATTKILASMKMAAISQRNTIRDYYDLWFITKHLLSLAETIEQTKRLIPGLSPITYTETLVYCADIPENNLQQHLNPISNVSKTEIADWFSQELKKLNL